MLIFPGEWGAKLKPCDLWVGTVSENATWALNLSASLLQVYRENEI